MSNIIKAASVNLEDKEVLDYKLRANLHIDYSSEDTDIIDVTDPDEDELLGMDAEMRERIEAIIDNAKLEADAIRAEARTFGYNDGLRDAEEYKKSLKKENAKKLEEELENLKNDNIQYLKGLENNIIDMIISISKNIMSESLEVDKKHILDLVIAGICKITDVEQLTIRVCKEDFDIITESKPNILKYFSPDTKLNIMIKDTMKKGDCIIETPYGIIDCGANTKAESILENFREVANI